MARIRFVYWQDDQARALIRRMEADGHVVDSDSRPPGQIWTDLRIDPPDALVISLRGKPAWGEQVAEATKNNRLKACALVFIDAPLEREQSERLARDYDEAVFTDAEDLTAALDRVLGVKG